MWFQFYLLILGLASVLTQEFNETGSVGCNGDPRAIEKRCPNPCPSTCDSPETIPCDKECEPLGCECEPGLLINPETGKCVYAEDCPAPVECTRPNEVWDECPNLSQCFFGKCADRMLQDYDCKPLLQNCQPQCVCKRDTFRNFSDICVPASECPPYCTTPDDCLRTCASPSPPSCYYHPAETNEFGCNCIDGYLLAHYGGECIKVEDCPDDVPCNGDPNARPKQCPPTRPASCKSPNAFWGEEKCEALGCECKPGYIISDKTGKCILIKECPDQ
ncbi:SCO-spondin-like isoform X2 [Anticarsia gemmatalis]|uniref:SCO-spondin-like isoform X2 n=1 Tax=Anticarsia gemmatalis TaxID=129554 RepID=UPI003F767E32